MILIRRIPIIMLGLLLAVSAEGRKQSFGPVGDLFEGVIHVSTSASGFWTYVTVSPQSGAPLSAAFTVQYQNRMPSVAYQGTGRVTLSEKSLGISSTDSGLLFKFPSYEGRLPAGQKALDVIGVASYSWPATGLRQPPLSHEDFVASQALRLEEDPPVCNYKECTCGGSGAQSCSCGGVQVSCYAPYEACCVPPSRAFCCQKPPEPERIKKSNRW